MTRCYRIMYEAEASRFKIRAKREAKAEFRRALKAEVERRGIIKADERTGEEMAEEALEGKTRRREDAEARLGVATEALKRAYKEAEWREVEEVVRKEEEEE